MPGRTVIIDIRTTGIALAIGIAMLASAFGLVATIDDAESSWSTVSTLLISALLFLGCALFSIRLATATFLIWRNGRENTSGDFGADPRPDRFRADDGRGG